MKKKRQERKQRQPSWQCSGEPTAEQIAAMLASGDIDAEDDRIWFEQHPGCLERLRPSTPREIIGGGGIPGSMTHVFRLSWGGHMRVICHPHTIN